MRRNLLDDRTRRAEEVVDLGPFAPREIERRLRGVHRLEERDDLEEEPVLGLGERRPPPDVGPHLPDRARQEGAGLVARLPPREDRDGVHRAGRDELQPGQTLGSHRCRDRLVRDVADAFRKEERDVATRVVCLTSVATACSWNQWSTAR